MLLRANQRVHCRNGSPAGVPLPAPWNHTSCGACCDLPTRCAATGCSQNMSPVGHKPLPAYVFAAQVHVSTNQLINTARVLADPTQQHLLQALAPLPLALPQQQPHQGGHNAHATTTAAPPSADTAGPSPQHHHQQQRQQQQQTPALSAAIVVGDEYYAAKEQLFIAEQALLRTMRFELGAQQPHKHLLNYVALLELSQHAAAAAVCVLNDAVAYTRVVCTHSAAVVAAAALQHVLATTTATGGDEGVVSRGRSSKEQQVAVASGQWVGLVGLPDAEVAAAQQEIAGLYRRLAVDTG